MSNYSQTHKRTVLSEIRRHLPENFSVESVTEVARRRGRVFSYSIRLFLRYLEEKDLIDEHTLSELRSRIKVPRTNPDLFVPSTQQVLLAFHELEEKYKDIFKLIAFSGIRRIDCFRFLSSFNEKLLFIKGNIARYPLQAFRKTKRTFFVYFPSAFTDEFPLNRTHPDTITKKFAVKPKYLRKWNYNFLIERGVPESVADFIQGRAPLSIGSMHYLARAKQADTWYSRVADELFELFS